MADTGDLEKLHKEIRLQIYEYVFADSSCAQLKLYVPRKREQRYVIEGRNYSGTPRREMAPVANERQLDHHGQKRENGSWVEIPRKTPLAVNSIVRAEACFIMYSKTLVSFEQANGPNDFKQTRTCDPPVVRTRWTVNGDSEGLPPLFIGRFANQFFAMRRVDDDYARWLPSTYDWSSMHDASESSSVDSLGVTPIGENGFILVCIFLQRLIRAGWSDRVCLYDDMIVRLHVFCMTKGKSVAEFIQEVSEETTTSSTCESVHSSVISYDWITNAIACSTDRYMTTTLAKLDLCMRDVQLSASPVKVLKAANFTEVFEEQRALAMSYVRPEGSSNNDVQEKNGQGDPSDEERSDAATEKRETIGPVSPSGAPSADEGLYADDNGYHHCPHCNSFHDRSEGSICPNHQADNDPAAPDEPVDHHIGQIEPEIPATMDGGETPVGPAVIPPTTAPLLDNSDTALPLRPSTRPKRKKWVMAADAHLK